MALDKTPEATVSYALLSAPADNRDPVVAADLEGTITAGSAWRGMYGYLLAHGRAFPARRLYYGRLPAYLALRIAGRELSGFKQRWLHDLLRLFHGYSREQFREMTDWAVAHELWPGRRRHVLEELAQYREQGHRVLIVTGQFEPYVASMLARLPAFEAIGTPLVFENHRVTGELVGTYRVGPRKAAALRPFARDGLIRAAYGDTVADRYMLAISQEPVAVHPDKRLRRLAESQGWRILEDTREAR